jgi:hypothetical protein
VNWKELKWVKEKDKKFELTGETLYGGQGKNRPIIIDQNELRDIQNKHEGQREDPTMQDIKPFYNGLSHPRLNHTAEVIVGHNKMKMRKENKQCRQEKQTNQPVISPWTMYKGIEGPTSPTDHTT